jgi:serine/threonine-protein kinase ULK/ATG1
MHRDIKPDNILIHNGVLKVADFGFCKPLEHQDGMAETMLGSPIYMAPEVLKGEPYTMKADVWSLGVVLYRLLFGFCPFESNNIGKLILMLNENELKMPENIKISPVLEELLRRMLTKDAKKRADWNEVFTYEITEGGEMLDPKLKNSLFTMRASTTGSSSIQSAINPVIKIEQVEENVRRIKRVESPKHNESSSAFKGDKNFNKSSMVPDNSLRETFKSKSPLRNTITNRYCKK